MMMIILRNDLWNFFGPGTRLPCYDYGTFQELGVQDEEWVRWADLGAGEMVRC
jgi:hypothetical protein